MTHPQLQAARIAFLDVGLVCTPSVAPAQHDQYAAGQPSPRTAEAFTLVELLVVIGIIAVLISVLLPALARARDAANSVKCLGNMRQVGMAVSLYVNETKGRWLPPYRMPEPTVNYVPGGAANNWNSAPYFYTWLSGKYFKEDPRIWICPSDRYVLNDTLGTQYRLYSRIKDTNSSYLMNRDMPQFTTPRYGHPYDHVYFNPRPLKGIKDATKLIIFAESAKGAGLASFRSDPAVFRWDHRKNTSMSICFADGHADQLHMREIMLRPGETYPPAIPRLSAYWWGDASYTNIRTFQW
jgi:type II secretory pathway pseudopilin PulG